MSAEIILFDGKYEFVEIERMGRDQNGRKVFWLNYHLTDADGGGQANGVWDGHSFSDAMAAAKEWGDMPVRIHPSARQEMH